MASFADDNTMILNAARRKYNNSTVVQNTSASVSAPAPERKTAAKPAPCVRRKPEESAVAKFVDRWVAYARRKRQKFADENRKAIRESFAAGTNKVDYNYDEYTVRDHNFPIGTFAVAFALTVISVFLLMNYSQISKYNGMINELDSQMKESEKVISELDMLVDKQTDISEIEEYAKSNGMVKADRVETKYINMSSSYKIVKKPVGEEGENVETAMSGVLRLFDEALGN